jgi:hypothetical protein
MNLIRKVARLSALVLAVQLIASCDTRLPTSSTGGNSDDVERPQVKFSLSAGTNNTVDVGSPLTVTIQATDNGGVSSILTRISNAAQVIGVDTISYRPTQLSVSRPVPVRTNGLSSGDRLTIRATVSDGAQNIRTDSIIITIADTSGPAVTVSSTKSGRGVKGGETLDINVSASDSSGIAYAGYRLLRIRATDSVLVKAESSFVAAGTAPTSFLTPPYSYVIPDTLLTGPYAVVGFAMDKSGVRTRAGAGASSVNFTVIDGTKPKLRFISPLAGDKVTVGDSMFVEVELSDNISLQRATLSGFSTRGNAQQGTLTDIQRYAPVSAPPNGNYTPGVRVDTVYRYLKVIAPVDTITDSLTVVGVVSDAASNTDTVSIRVKMVSGPKVTFISPVPGDSANRGGGLTVSLRATSAVGVLSLGFRIQSAPGWPIPVDTTVKVVYSPALKTALMQASIKIDSSAPPKGLLTITPISVDVNGQDGSSNPITIAVRAGTPPGPRVNQAIGARVETSDVDSISAIGNGITYVGFEARDAASGSIIKRDSAAVSGNPSSVVQAVPFNFLPTVQGKRISVLSFAYDQNGQVGYSLPAGATTPQPAYSLAFTDAALVVYGHTYSLPTNRNGVIADLAVDQARGNVFLSNINYGRLEVWQKSAQNFDANGVVVGSQPWGITMSRAGGTAGNMLYVANSGGTNISKVDIAQTSVSSMKEDLANRLLTRVSFLYRMTEVRDPSTLKIRNTVSAPILFSDRPQFVEQSSSGRLYISTKPTAAAPTGTVRYLDPATAAPDERFILAFATVGNDPNSWLIANVDFAGVVPAPATSIANDQVTLCDHASGTTAAATCVSSTLGILDAITQLKASVPTSDVDWGVNLDENSLGLSDTTFAASSGDGHWITFGEGNTKHVFARDFLLKDDGTSPFNTYNYASPAINVTDLINNAADKVYGVALDKSGKTIGIHGQESYFAAVTQPFTQRLQGKKSTFNAGAGIAFHPNADGTTTPNADRLAFVASANGSIEVIDIAYYDFARGSLATKYNLYGPLRASLPFPGDDPSVKFKLFGLSPTGLVVIDVTAADILAGP